MSEQTPYSGNVIDSAAITEAFATVTPEDIIGAGAVGNAVEKPFGVDLMTSASPEDAIFATRGTGTLTKVEPNPDRDTDD